MRNEFLKMKKYSEFIKTKDHFREDHGFEPLFTPEILFDFQRHLLAWALKKGRSATFADCGLGKTGLALCWAENIVRKTNKPVLILTPLAVGPQFVEEGEKFGVECEQSRDGKFTKKIVVTNYERLHLFNSEDFVGCVGDESSILKNFDGATKAAVTEFMLKLPYRWLGTATPAPNDFIELGTTSEAIGELGYMDMLARFFKNDQNSSHPNRLRGNAKWRFRGHSEPDFWRWVSSWARAIRKPSDLGFSDERFVLPKLETRQHCISATIKKDGFLFDMPAHSLDEQREERRRTLKERCERTAELVTEVKGQSLIWCHLNEEGDVLEKMIAGAIQVTGSDSIEHKEDALDAFRRGKIDKLISKPDICGHGLNFQRCAHQTFFPSHSFEQWYQAIRRSWRFGQKKKVVVDIITSEGEARVLENLQRKAKSSEEMFTMLVSLMNAELKIERKDGTINKITKPSFL